MSRRWAVTSVASAATLLLGGLVSSCSGALATPSASPTAGSSTNAVEIGQREAVKALDAWLADPKPGTLTINSVETDARDRTSVSRLLTGPIDIAAGTGSLDGTITVLARGSTTQQRQQAIEMDGHLYTTVPSAQTPAHPVQEWYASDLSKFAPAGSKHSVWWATLKALRTVHLDGPSTVGTSTATEYTGTVNVADLTEPGVAGLVASSAVFKQAGTTNVYVDVYTDLGTGRLLRVTYRLGLPVRVDASPTAHSTAGYQVDYSTLVASPSATPSVAPPDHLVTSGGSGDLCQLLLF